MEEKESDSPFRFEPCVCTKHGVSFLLRMIKPSDAPAWREMIESCSPETIWKRFELRSKEALLSKAESFCNCNPKSELVVVAELLGKKKLVGEARLCLAPRCQAEFCVLVADPWQGLGLGSVLTDFAMTFARRLGVKRVVVEVVPENVRIIAMLKRRGFSFFRNPQGRIVFGEKIF